MNSHFSNTTRHTSAKKVCLLLDKEAVNDVRVFHKEAHSLRDAGWNVCVIGMERRDCEIEGITVRAITPFVKRWQRFIYPFFHIIGPAIREKANLYQINDLTLVPVGLFLRLTGRNVVYDVHEDHIAYKEWVPRGLRTLVAASARTFEHASVRVFQGVICAGVEIEERLAHRTKRVITIHNYPRLQELKSGSPTRKSTGNSGEFVLANFGGISEGRCTRILVEALGILPDSARVKMLLGGKLGAHQSYLDQLKKMAGWRRVEYLGVVSREELGAQLGQSDIVINLYMPHPNHYDIRSNRVYESLGAGLPVLVSDFPRWKKFVEEESVGFSVDPTSPRNICDKIMQLTEIREELREMGQRAAKLVLHRLNWEAQAQDYVDFLEKSCS